MCVAMAGQTLMFRTSALMNGNSKLIFSNRISHVNLIAPYMGLKNDARALIDNYKLPEKPKRPLTAYFKFMQEKRPIILKENPSLHSKEVVKRISEQWNALSIEGKAKYEEAAIQDKEKYDETLLNYNAKLTPEQEELLHQIESDKRKERKKRQIKKESKIAGKPKRPLTSFGLFVQENTPAGKSVGTFFPDLKVKWAEMSEIEKQKYQIQYQRHREKYDIDLAKWESEMIEDGKSYLVRAKTLKKNPSFQGKIKKSKPQ